MDTDSRSAIEDSNGRFRFGKHKGTPLVDIPSHILGQTASWALDVARACQQELDRRVEELRAKEAE